jgi:hypothetical protein
LKCSIGSCPGFRPFYSGLIASEGSLETSLLCDS